MLVNNIKVGSICLKNSDKDNRYYDVGLSCELNYDSKTIDFLYYCMFDMETNEFGVKWPIADTSIDIEGTYYTSDGRHYAVSTNYKDVPIYSLYGYNNYIANSIFNYVKDNEQTLSVEARKAVVNSLI